MTNEPLNPLITKKYLEINITFFKEHKLNPTQIGFLIERLGSEWHQALAIHHLSKYFMAHPEELKKIMNEASKDET